MDADGPGLIGEFVGKRKAIRTVPIPAWTRAVIDHRTTVARIKGGRLSGERLSVQASTLEGKAATQCSRRIARITTVTKITDGFNFYPFEGVL